MAVVVAGAGVDSAARRVDHEVAAPHAGPAVAGGRGVQRPKEFARLRLHRDDAAAGSAADETRKEGRQALLIGRHARVHDAVGDDR
jgi:hypothetical protein